MAHEIVEQTFEIARHLDVHAGADGGHDIADLHGAGLEEAGENVVAIGRDDQPVHRQAHAPRDVTGEYVAEIPARNRERDGPVGSAEGDPGGHVVNRLRGDPRPVDRVHGGQPAFRAEPGVAEHRLHQSLAIVEGPFDGDVVDVGGIDGRHLAALDFGTPAPSGAARRSPCRPGRGRLRSPPTPYRRRSPRRRSPSRRAWRAHGRTADRRSGGHSP